MEVTSLNVARLNFSDILCQWARCSLLRDGGKRMTSLRTTCLLNFQRQQAGSPTEDSKSGVVGILQGLCKCTSLGKTDKKYMSRLLLVSFLGLSFSSSVLGLMRSENHSISCFSSWYPASCRNSNVKTCTPLVCKHGSHANARSLLCAAGHHSIQGLSMESVVQMNLYRNNCLES